jgi:hypothetical protein
MKQARRILFGVTVLLLTVIGDAHADPLGTLREDLPWKIEAIHVGRQAVTIYYLGKGLDVEAILTLDEGQSFFSQEFPRPARVKRVIVEFVSRSNGEAFVTILQGSTAVLEHAVLQQGQGTIVLDVTSAP